MAVEKRECLDAVTLSCTIIKVNNFGYNLIADRKKELRFFMLWRIKVLPCSGNKTIEAGERQGIKEGKFI